MHYWPSWYFYWSNSLEIIGWQSAQFICRSTPVLTRCEHVCIMLVFSDSALEVFLQYMNLASSYLLTYIVGRTDSAVIVDSLHVCIAGPHHRPIVTDGVAWSVCLSVCHSREPCKKWLNQSRCCLGCGLILAQGTMYYMGVHIPLRRGNFEGEKWRPSCKVLGLYAMSCSKTAEPMQMSFGMQACVGPKKHVLDVGAQWRHLANTIASAMRPLVTLLWLLVMAALCNRAGHYIFALWFLLSSIDLFFRRLISAAADWLSTILPHMVWPQCKFKMQVWNLLHAARWKYRMQKSRQKLPCGHHHTTLSGYIFLLFFLA